MKRHDILCPMLPRPATRGAALIITLAVLVLVTFLIMALFVTVSSERMESSASASKGDADQLAAGVVDLVKATITQATAGYESNAGTGALDTSKRTAWASQPGLIRTWSESGAPYRSYRLYSGGNSATDTIAVDGSLNVATDAPPAGWKSGGAPYNAIWSDLNSPAATGTGLSYPIVTPPGDTNSGSVATDTNNGVPTDNPATAAQEGVQGFSITNAPGFSAGTASATNNPAPMPVKWLYVLKDGTFVSPTGTGDVANVAGASKSNPIVGRVAYWTDDETCKVNINTASEGVYWDKPYGNNREESGLLTTPPTLGFSLSIPSTGEFQRLPGHPAFTSLSAVFGGTNWLQRPEIGFGPEGASAYSGGTFANNIIPYYNLVPRIGDGGTRGGTRFILDPSISGNSIVLDSDRLYASANELLFNPARLDNNLALTPERIKQAQFFTTTTSKAPETTLLEQPRVSLWPLQQAATVRNAKDRLLAYCATVKGSAGDNPYYFQRISEWQSNDSPGSSQNPTNDVSFGRNLQLLNYLNNSANTKVPSFGSSLSAKYPGAKLSQIVLSMFDTIRSLVNTTSRSIKESPNLPSGYSYSPYTVGGASGTTDYPVGVGTVVPATTAVDGAGNFTPAGATKIKGFGRWPVLSEVVIVFMPTEWKDNTTFATSELQNSTAADVFSVNGSNFTDPSVRWKPSPGPDGLPDDFPNGPYTASDPKVGLNANQLAALVNAGRANNLGESLVNDLTVPQFYIHDNECLGDPQTTRLRAFILLGFLNPSPGQPELCPAVRYQIAGLDTLSINDASLGFPAANNAVLLMRNNQIRHPFPEGIFEIQLTSAQDTLRIPSASDGITAGSGKNDPKNTFFPFLSQEIALVQPAQPGRWGLVRDATMPDGISVYKYENLRPSLTPTTMAFSGGNLTVSVFPGTGNNFAPGDCIQTFNIQFPPATLPVPLIIRSTFGPRPATAEPNPNFNIPDFSWWARPDDKSQAVFYSGLQGPKTGALSTIVSRADGRLFSGGSGRMDRIDMSPPTGASGSGLVLGANTWSSLIRRGDVVRSMALDPLGPLKGDLRLLAGVTDVPASVFAPSGGIGTYTDSSILQAAGATYRAANQNSRYNLIYGTVPSVTSNPHSWYANWRRHLDEALGRLVNVNYRGGKNKDETLRPNVPRPVGPSVAHNAPSDLPIATRGNTANPGDWNTGVGSFVDGPFINSGEQGYLNAAIGDSASNMYFPSNTGSAASGGSLSSFSPNRQVSSPVLFGSLPSGIDPVNPASSSPWQTLLFCPNPADRSNHPGFGAGGTINGPDARPPFSTVPDHLFLDLFWMPVVEPYAISEPLATAGKINLNFPMAPFPHIERSTGLFAALKAVRMPAIPDIRADDYKGFMSGVPSSTDADTANRASWRYNIDVPAVLAGMKDRRFSNNDAYRSASEVTTIFMVPSRQPGSPSSPDGPSGATPLARYNNTASWWDDMKLSGDNLRETPYDHLYSRITTKSNTFTVHYRVQALKQAGSRTDWATWNEATDQVLSESRGSATIERYVDPNDTSIPDFAQPANYTRNLAPYYRWRTLVAKQFVP